VLCSRERGAKWAKSNPGKVKAIKKRCRQNNKESELEYRKSYYERHKDDPLRKAAKAEYDRKYRKKNAEKLQAMKASWRERNADLVRSIRRNYKAKRRAAEASGVSSSDLAAWIDSQDKVCAWCKRDCGNNYHVDHIEPLARGGAHELHNMTIACPTCNMRKNARDPAEFAAELHRVGVEQL
jgi:5-methylcytosine-specific restriction endonuclease McrA